MEEIKLKATTFSVTVIQSNNGKIKITNPQADNNHLSENFFTMALRQLSELERTYNKNNK